MLGVNFFVVHSKASSLCKLNLDKNWACWNLERCFVFFFVSVARLCLRAFLTVSVTAPASDFFCSAPHEDTNSFSTFVVDLGFALLLFCDKMLVKDASVVHWHVWIR